jgi:hypothetical protein
MSAIEIGLGVFGYFTAGFICCLAAYGSWRLTFITSGPPRVSMWASFLFPPWGFLSAYVWALAWLMSGRERL